MKHFLLLLAGPLFTLVSMAQQILPERQYLVKEFAESVKVFPDAKSRLAAFTRYIHTAPAGARETNELAQRIVGYYSANYQNGNILSVDSVNWTYGLNRGGSSVDNVMYNERRGYVLNNNIQPNYLYIRTWDAWNHNEQLQEKEWINNAFSDKNRTLYAYDANDNRTNATSQTWGGLAWNYTTRSEFTFNTNHQQLIETVSDWLDTVWVQQYRYSYSYDVNGFLSEELYQEFNGNAFENGFHLVYTNDISGNHLTELHRNWVNNGWQNDIRFTFTYDSLHRQQTGILERWTGSAWLNEDKWEYAYHSSGNLLADIAFAWNGTTWDTIRKTHFIVANNLLVEDSMQLFIAGSWQNSSRTTYTYDATMNPDEVTFYTWNGGGWQNNKLINYDFNPVNFKIDHILNQLWNSNAWQTEQDRYYYYEDYDILATALMDIKHTSGKLNVYPNPSTALLNINYTTTEPGTGNLRVYDASGQQIVTTALQVNRGDNYLPLKVDNLAGGFYVLEVEAPNGYARTKFYKQ